MHGVARWDDHRGHQDHRQVHPDALHPDHLDGHRPDRQRQLGLAEGRRSHQGVRPLGHRYAAGSHPAAPRRALKDAKGLLHRGHLAHLGGRCSRRLGADHSLLGRCAARCWRASRRAEEESLCRTLMSGDHLVAAAESGGRKLRSVALTRPDVQVAG